MPELHQLLNLDFNLLQNIEYQIGSISAVGIDCIDFSNLPASTNMNVVSDVMKWNDGNSWAWIRLTQPTPFHPTMMRVDYSGASSIGKFHVHSYQSDDLSDCTSVGGHYNPFNVDLSQSSNQDQETRGEDKTQGCGFWWCVLREFDRCQGMD